MALRLVEIYLPRGVDGLGALDEGANVLGRWSLPVDGERTLERILIDTEGTESLLAWVDQQVVLSDDYRILISPVEATLPRPEDAPDEPSGPAAAPNRLDERTAGRISREELYQDVDDAIRGTGVFYAFVVLSTVVAAGGLLRDSVAIVIGAMVIAPLIGPNIALALGTTLGDTDLLSRAMKINLGGLLLALVLSVGIGLALPVDPTVREIAARTWVRLDDIVLALAAGAAGALAMSRGAPMALVGVMVAVALLPPLVTFGLLVGAGYGRLAYGAFMLVVSNLAAVNLSGVCTFLIQGIRPMRWYEAEQARRATRRAIVLWTIVFAILIVAMLLADRPTF